MRCLSCMTVNPRGNRFCEQCGSQLQQSCARCGHDVSPGARFCGNCGHAMHAAASPAAAEASPKWGELKQATVLFADIVGSTEMIAGLDPEQAMARLRPAVLRMRHSVERFGGTVVRTLGDGVMALFGVPQALEGHALLACQAALHMQKTFAAGADGLSLRVGLHSGQVASDPADAEDGRGGGAHGLTIHLASRVVALAPPAGVCITEACRLAAGRTCDTTPLGPHMLKGIAEAVAVHQLLAVQPLGTPRTEFAGSTFRGRAAELSRLLEAHAEVEQGGSRVVGIAGEPGAGKSRLCQEFAESCRARGIALHDVRAQLYGHALPLQPVLELFRVHFFGIAAGDKSETSRERIARCFSVISPAEADLEILYEFFGVAAAEPSTALGPRARQTRLLGLLKQLLQAQADLQRVILIEDLHWLDEGSEEFVSLLVEAVAGTRTFLLLNYRPSYRCPWLQLPHYAQLDLRELAVEDMDSLVAELLASARPAPEVRQVVCRRASGNPFFAEELVRSLLEQGVLSPETGLPAGGVEALESALPATVEAVVGARLDRVGEPEKTLLQMCAIIGKDIPLAVLQHVAHPIAHLIERGLEGLCRAGLILPQPAVGGRRFAFRHPLIQEVAYGTQFRLRRGQLHADVAAAMELYYADRLDEFAGLVGYHFEQAGEQLQAARYNARAAAWVGTTNPAQSIKHWRKVRALLQDVPRTSEADRLRATAGAKIALLGWREGMTLAEVKPLIDDALALANQVDDRLVPWLLTIEGRMLVASGGPADGYVECVKKALLYIDLDRDSGRLAVAHAFLSQAYSWAGLLHEALQANDIALGNAQHVDPFDREFIGFSIEQWVLSVRSRVLARMGKADEARACLQRVAALEADATALPVPGMTALASIELAWLVDDAELARRHAQDFVAISQRHGTPYLKAFADGYHGLSGLIAGEHGAALASLQSALTNVRDSGAATEFETEILALMAECRLRMGDHEGAHAAADEAVRLSRVRRTRVAECRARIVRGAAAQALDVQAEVVDDDFRQAEALIAQTGAVACAAALASARQARTSSVTSRRP